MGFPEKERTTCSGDRKLNAFPRIRSVGETSRMPSQILLMTGTTSVNARPTMPGPAPAAASAEASRAPVGNFVSQVVTGTRKASR